MTTVVIATRNLHKMREIRAVLPETLRFLTLHDFPSAPEVTEDADTFAGNATKKAITLAAWLLREGKLPFPQDFFAPAYYVLADDSGLEVDVLAGAPGVHSARYAALETGCPGNASDAANNAKLLRLLAGVELKRRTARFRCVAALTPVPDLRISETRSPANLEELAAQTRLFEGMCEGHIGFEPRGAGGFGYDPLFIPRGSDRTFAELHDSIKNTQSHRARALAGLCQAWKKMRQSARLAHPQE